MTADSLTAFYSPDILNASCLGIVTRFTLSSLSPLATGLYDVETLKKIMILTRTSWKIIYSFAQLNGFNEIKVQA